MLNVIFFKKPNPDCYDECPDETYVAGSNNTACQEMCDDDCEDNGLVSSILSATIAGPIGATLNYLFAWLRKPFEQDVRVKSGSAVETLKERDAEELDARHTAKHDEFRDALPTYAAVFLTAAPEGSAHHVQPKKRRCCCKPVPTKHSANPYRNAAAK